MIKFSENIDPQKEFDKAKAMWVRATNESPSIKRNLIIQAKKLVIDACLKVSGTPEQVFDKLEILKRKNTNPLVASAINEVQNSLRHSIKIRNF